MSESLLRLDKLLASMYPSLSRSTIQRLIKSGYTKISGTVATKPSQMVEPDAAVSIDTVALQEPETVLQLPILYEDEDCVVVDKPTGVLVHSKGAFNAEPTLASWLRTRPGFAFEDELNLRAGIVHRLDRATSGVIICAKNVKTLGYLQKQFKDRNVKKTYVARVSGHVEPEHAMIDLPIDRNPKKPQTFRVGASGKPAQTEYRVLSVDDDSSLVEMKPITGRTHQLRVHMHYIKHPIIGDLMYAGRPANRLYLHAKSLEISLPHGIRKVFESTIPKEFLA